jgi:L,D-transpeptidase catalytic domain
VKKIIATLLFILFLSGIASAWLNLSGEGKKLKSLYLPKTPARFEISKSILRKLKLKAFEARAFTLRNNYNNRICFLIDMSIGSGQNRFFVYDLKNDTIQNAGLVTHGRCNENWLEGRKYGNEVECGCTALGKYRIGNSYDGRFGQAFKLYGLERTNDKAFERFVVLHSHECVPETEVKGEICQSDGCPTLSPGFLQQLKPMITSSKKPVLLWIYE